MPNLIIQHSETLWTFLMPLIAALGGAQQMHALNIIGALLVCSAKHKCLTVLTAMLRVKHADHFAMADFVRQSHWDEVALRAAVLQRVMGVAMAGVIRVCAKRVFLAVDDSLCVKDVGTWKLAAVKFQFDHVKQRRQWKNYTNASRYIAMCVCIPTRLGTLSFPLTWRLYVSAAQARKINRAEGRSGETRVMYRTLPDLALDMLTEIAALVPAELRATVYVLFDSWFDSNRLLKRVRAFSRPHQAWHFVCASSSHRSLDGIQVKQWWSKLSSTKVRRVRICSTKGSRTYLTRERVGRLRQVPFQVKLVISKRHRKDTRPAYFLSSHVGLSAETILKCYAYRWQSECDNWFVKEQLGLADYRVQSFTAISRWHTLVFAAYAFVAVHRAETWLKHMSDPWLSNSAILQQQRREQFEHLVRLVARRARAGQDDSTILADLLPPT